MGGHGRGSWATAQGAVSCIFAAAVTSYLASCAVGAGVASGVVDVRNFRWIHHALYISTVVLAGAAVSSLSWSESRAGWRLLPAAVPLAVLPKLGPRFPRHPLIGLAAAPFFLAGYVHSRR